MVIPALFVSNGEVVHFPFKSITGKEHEFILSETASECGEFHVAHHYSILDFIEKWTK